VLLASANALHGAVATTFGGVGVSMVKAHEEDR